jgi:hypothetical protein
MKINQTKNRGIKRWIVGMIGGGLLAALPVHAATVINIVNGGFEDPEMPDGWNASFNGVYGGLGVVPGWDGSDSNTAGVMRVDAQFPGRTGNNVMYFEGQFGATDPYQNFHTAGFDLGVNLQSNSTYTLTFDVMGRLGITTEQLVIFRLGVYTGDSYENRTPISLDAEFAGNVYLLDDVSEPVFAKTMTLTFTTGEVAPDTLFWIGGDAYGNDLVQHRPYFDNFGLTVEPIPEPSTLGLVGLAAVGGVFMRQRAKHRRNR